MFFILQTLQKHSDEQNPLTSSQVAAKINSEYASILPGDGIDKKTVSRNLDELAILGSHGPVRMVMKSKLPGESFVPYRSSETGRSQTKYFYYRQPFKKEQILALRDSIEAYNYITTQNIADIVKGLMAVCPESYDITKYLSNDPNDANLKKPEARVLDNIRILSRIIKTKGIALITYCNYGTDCALHPRSGYPKFFKPLKLVWGNGYYYCACFNEKFDTPVNLRIDRIVEIKEADRKDVPEKILEILNSKKDRTNQLATGSSYRTFHPIMFGGKLIPVTMLVRTDEKNGMINALVDIFGMDKNNLQMTDAAEEDMKEAFSSVPEKLSPDEKWIKVRISKTTFGGMALVAVQYCQNIRIIKPDDLATEVKLRLKQAAELYK